MKAQMKRMNMTKAISQLLDIYWTKITILTILALLTSSLSVYAEKSTIKNSTIIVTATGTSQATPDMAVMNLAVITHDKTAQKALEANNKSINNIIDSFKKEGIQKKDIQTSNLSIYHINPDKHQEQRNDESLYQVSHSLTVRIRDLLNAGMIFDQAMGLGMNSVRGITFTNIDTKPFYTAARKQAIAEAIEKAKTLAQAANVKLGKIIEINESNDSSHLMPHLISRAQTASYADTHFSNGELNYSVNVTVTFAID